MKHIQTFESFLNEGFDAKYWEDYHEKAEKIKSNSAVANAVEDSVNDWNDNNTEGPSNAIDKKGEATVMELAHKFFAAKGWISTDIIGAMIAQEA